MSDYTIYKELSALPHLLIAGATGSGKSVLLNGIIHYLTTQTDAGLFLIDPKQVELNEYRHLPCTGAYANTTDGAIRVLESAVRIMEDRYRRMARKHVKAYDGQHLYVIIDEYADLIVTGKKRVQPLCLRIAQLGRAARVHLFIATQRPTANIITGDIKVNMDNRVALHVPTAQDSRNILGCKDAMHLPRFGRGLWFSPAGIEEVALPMLSAGDQQAFSAMIMKEPEGLLNRLVRRFNGSDR